MGWLALLKMRRHLVVNSAVISMPVIAPAMVAEIVCASIITRAYIVKSMIGITISENQRLYRRIIKKAPALASVEWPDGMLCWELGERGRSPRRVPITVTSFRRRLGPWDAAIPATVTTANCLSPFQSRKTMIVANGKSVLRCRPYSSVTITTDEDCPPLGVA